MRKIVLTFAAVILMWGLTAAPALADWGPADGHKMHNPQLPDEMGWDVKATHPLVLADDWLCTGTGPVTDIHFWGSWMHGAPGAIMSFTLRIYADIPADPPAIPYSRPGALLWMQEIPHEMVMQVAIEGGLEGWYDPQTQTIFPEDHVEYFQYNIFLPEEMWFEQVAETVYWLSITAHVAEPALTQWGWKSSYIHWNDDAVWAIDDLFDWIDLWEPPDGLVSMDLAFVITGPDEEPLGACCYDDPTGAGYICLVTTEDSCVNYYGGTYNGDGSLCGTVQACCLSTGICIDVDSLCCVTDLGGAPQGTGVYCSGVTEACCFTDGSCMDLDPLCCADQGGTPQGLGTFCLGDGNHNTIDDACETLPDEACCLGDGTCIDTDRASCINAGGVPQGPGTVCSGITVACCLPGGGCANLDPLCCDELGGIASPTGASACLGDNDLNGTDDACEGPGWDPGDPHKMHFPQLPDETGWDVNATVPMILADDWECSETGWVKDIHFWGSWLDDIEGVVDSFTLSFHYDIPVDSPQILYSRPGELIDEFNVNEFVIVPIDPPAMEGWYDPMQDLVLFDNHNHYFQYNVYLPEDQWIWQDSGIVYWLNISAHVDPTGGGRWGWKSSSQHWNDDAVWAEWYDLTWEEMYEPSQMIGNAFYLTINPDYTFGGGGGEEAFGNGWYYYPDSEWWNIWFYDHPYDPDRIKPIRLEIQTNLADEGQSGYIEIALNWSTDLWSLEGNPPGEDRYPPVPPVDEAAFIGRRILYAGDVYPEVFTFEDTLWEYNPEWVSVDVQGVNFTVEGVIWHDCVTSLDLAFVITGESDVQEPTGACCYPLPGTPLDNTDCIVTTEDSCLTYYGGVYQGDDTQCGTYQACCLDDNTCIMADSLCCIAELGGTPQGTGTTCGGMQACCTSAGACFDVDSICCVNQLGGTPQGDGTSCGLITIACCLPNGTCQDVAPVCCDDLGGTPSTTAGACLGDGDLNGVDDACETPLELKWEQPPELTPMGMDVFDSRMPDGSAVLLADDFYCTDSGAITEIHVWASWYHDEYPPAGPCSVPITLSFHHDVPAGIELPYSHPGEMLWMFTFMPGMYECMPYATDLMEGWYWPFDQGPGAWEEMGDFTCWEYIFYVPEGEEFVQQGTETDPLIYWLDVQADLREVQAEVFFGWKTTPLDFNWNDDACWLAGIEPGNPLSWGEMRYPEMHPWVGESINLAFALYGVFGDTCDEQYPGDVNNDGDILADDIIYLVAFLYTGGAAPPVMANADVNGDCYIDQADVEYLVAFVYQQGDPPVDCTCQNPQVCDCFIADANNDGSLNVGDAVYIINYVFKQGPAPVPYDTCSGDANTDCSVNVGDAVYMINYVFKQGPRPNYCHQWIQPKPTGCGLPIRE